MTVVTDGGDPSGVTVRAMRREEAQRVGALTLASYDAHGSLQGEYRDYLGDPLRRIDGCTALLVATLDGEVAGTVTYVEPTDAEWEGRALFDGDCGFRVLAVAPGFEGRGVGRALVTTCLDRARASGRRRAFITSMDWMTRAHRLYEQLGFVRRPDLDVQFPGGIGVAFVCDLVPDAAEHFPAPGPVPARPPRYQDVWPT
jgi:GNAT superfamily N-acetyltransferase